ncbi:MAG: hypothetical protein ACFB6S_13605 [Geminicoccaceae bacterium]
MAESTDVRAATASEPFWGGYVDWPAILAGALVAAAIFLVFTQFGAAFGLSMISPYGDEGIGYFAAVIVGLWVVLSTIASFMVGGYLAGRLRRRMDGASDSEISVRDGSHGLVVWAGGVLIGGVIVSSIATTTAQLGSSAVSATVEAGASAVSGAADAVSSAASTAGQGLPEGVTANPIDYINNNLLRGSTAGGGDGQSANGEGEGQNADGSDNAGGGSGADLERLRQEARSILMNVLRTGEISQEDRDYLTQAIANQTNLEQEQIDQRVSQAVEAAQNARQETIDTAQAAVDQAQSVADAARRYSMISAFALAAALVVAGAAAYWAARVGGRHRDEGRQPAGFGRWS